MEDLDQLQMDLESLLSKAAVRQRLLQNEILAMNNSESNLDRGKAVSHLSITGLNIFWFIPNHGYFIFVSTVFSFSQSSPGKKGRSRGKLIENLTKTRDGARSSTSKHSKKIYRLAPLAGSVPVSPIILNFFACVFSLNWC